MISPSSAISSLLLFEANFLADSRFWEPSTFFENLFLSLRSSGEASSSWEPEVWMIPKASVSVPATRLTEWCKWRYLFLYAGFSEVTWDRSRVWENFGLYPWAGTLCSSCFYMNVLWYCSRLTCYSNDKWQDIILLRVDMFGSKLNDSKRFSLSSFIISNLRAACLPKSCLFYSPYNL